MKPFIEVDGEVFMVMDWELDMPEKDFLQLRKLTVKEKDIYRKLRRELEVEFHQNFVSG